MVYIIVLNFNNPNVTLECLESLKCLSFNDYHIILVDNASTDNSKDMSSLTIKHQEISEAQSTIEDSIQSQSDEIDTALMATTEIFESILE